MNSAEPFLRRDIDLTISQIDECVIESQRWMELACLYEDHLVELRTRLGEVAVTEELATITHIHERKLEVAKGDDSA